MGQLSDRAPPRPRRHGRGLRGGTSVVRTSCRAEGVEQSAAERRRAGALFARGAARGLRQPSAHGLYLWQRGDRRDAGDLDGAAAGRHAEGSSDRRRPDAVRRGGGCGHGRDRRTRRRGGSRDPASRHQAVELLRRPRWRREGGRLRPVDLDPRPRRPPAARDIRLRGDPAVCSSRAVARRAARRSGRHLRGRRDPLLPADGAGTFRRAGSP